MAQSVTLSSAGTATLILNPVAKSTTVMLTQLTAGSSLTVVTIEMTLGDPTQYGGPALTWVPLSSATAMPSSAGSLTNGLVYTVLSPIGGVRLNSTTNAGSSGSFNLQALQAVTA